MRSVALHNLGCKVNSYELDAVQSMLIQQGYRIVPFEEKADIYIINTCTVTNMADRKSRQMLHRAKKQNPEALVVAIGCYVQNGVEDVKEDPCVDLAIGNNRKKDLVTILEDYLAKRQTIDTVVDIAKEKEYEELEIDRTAEHTRAYIKIQDGCNQFCTYCAIPLARGRVRSRDRGLVLEEVKRLAANRYKEVVLTGIHLSSYGLDFLGISSADYRDACEAGFLLNLIEEIAGVPGVERIRLGSLEPRIITPEFVKRLSACDKICPHFHLSLQSGCDATLKRMNRHYNTQQFREGVALLREAFERVAITTDVIVGFPGETDEEFEQTVAFLEEISFYEMHVFKYSKRKNTPAAIMPGQVLDDIKNKRSDILLAMDRQKSRHYREEYLGKRMEILTEEIRQIGEYCYMTGHTRDYVCCAFRVEGDASALSEAEHSLKNKLVTGTATELLDDEIVLLADVEKIGG